MSFFMTLKLNIILLLIFSCNNQPTIQKSDSRKSNITQNESDSNIVSTEETEEEEEEEEEEEKKVDPSTLKVISLNIANLASQDGSGKTQNIMRLDVSGETEYIYILICPMEDSGKECPEGRVCVAEGAGQCVTEVTSFTRLILEPIYAGDVKIKAQACIKKSRSLTDENCSSWKITNYNSKRSNDEVIAKFNERARYKESVNFLVNDHRAYLQFWMEQSEECKKQNAEAAAHLQNAMDITEMFLGAPADLVVGLLLENPAAELASPYVSEFGAAVQKKLYDMCKDLDQEDSDPACSKIAEIMAMGGMFWDGMMNPMTSVGVLIDACNTISNPKASVVKTCQQQSKLSIAHQKYYTQLEIAIRGYKRVSAELEEMGEL